MVSIIVDAMDWLLNCYNLKPVSVEISGAILTCDASIPFFLYGPLISRPFRTQLERAWWMS